jgi:hypothetical protein
VKSWVYMAIATAVGVTLGALSVIFLWLAMRV